jgi:hypothetical protein
MRTKYKGYEINVWRERCSGGWTQLYYTIFGIENRREYLCNFEDSTETQRSMTAILKGRIDAELADAMPWGEDSK